MVYRTDTREERVVDLAYEMLIHKLTSYTGRTKLDHYLSLKNLIYDFYNGLIGKLD